MRCLSMFAERALIDRVDSGRGLGMMVQMASSNTILQTIVEESKRGRIMSPFAMAYMGMAPFGSLFGGFLADRIGAAVTLQCGGVICCLGALVFRRRSRRRRKKSDQSVVSPRSSTSRREATLGSSGHRSRVQSNSTPHSARWCSRTPAGRSTDPDRIRRSRSRPSTCGRSPVAVC